MSKDQKEICLHCKWWKFDKLPIYESMWLEQRGTCRINPPQWVQWGSIAHENEGLNAESSWPSCIGGDFCGKFEERRDDHE